MRRSSRLTPKGCHLLPRAVRIPRRFNSRAIAERETKPTSLNIRIVAARTLARASAARLCASLIFTLPLRTVIKPRRRSTALTVPRCQRPPRAPRIPLRFNSAARARSEKKAAAMSLRKMGSKRACSSAARLAANPSPLPWAEAFSRCFIGRSWPGVQPMSCNHKTQCEFNSGGAGFGLALWARVADPRGNLRPSSWAGP
jgi:hypothetical protein